MSPPSLGAEVAMPMDVSELPSEEECLQGEDGWMVSAQPDMEPRLPPEVTADIEEELNDDHDEFDEDIDDVDALLWKWTTLHI